MFWTMLLPWSCFLFYISLHALQGHSEYSTVIYEKLHPQANSSLWTNISHSLLAVGTYHFHLSGLVLIPGTTNQLLMQPEDKVISLTTDSLTKRQRTFKTGCLPRQKVRSNLSKAPPLSDERTTRGKKVLRLQWKWEAVMRTRRIKATSMTPVAIKINLFPRKPLLPRSHQQVTYNFLLKYFHFTATKRQIINCSRFSTFGWSCFCILKYIHFGGECQW